MENEITQWEYKTLNKRFLEEEELNKLGKEGWEMTGQTECAGGETSQAIFKRPKKAQPKKEPDYGYSR